ncbi:DUF1345 domain-containing protein [Streptomyces sp. 4.24]|uniref:DUF1345 domain-containing protein n=1 Tax=Streptomyces tritrimontium TaxID=3406573 RepID=UPI003BB677BE
MSKWLLGALELSLIGLSAAWLWLYGDKIAVELLATWNALALAYAALTWLHMSRMIPAQDEEAELRDLTVPSWYTTLLVLAASGSGLAGGLVLLADRHDDGGGDLAPQWLAALTVLTAWLLLHTAYARLYARAHYADGGLNFPECPRPTLTEFVYFSFTIGTSFAVSDVTVTTTPMRRRVTAHSVFSFFFNAAVVAIAIDWLKA